MRPEKSHFQRACRGDLRSKLFRVCGRESLRRLFAAVRGGKVSDAWVRWAVSRPWGAKCAGGVRAGRCFALFERKMRAWGGAETLFCDRGAQNACFLECCFAPGGRERRIFRFDEGKIGNLNAGFCGKYAKRGYPFARRRAIITLYWYLYDVMSKTGERPYPQTGKWESKELGASQGRKSRSAVDPAPEKGMEKTDQAEHRSCLAER